MLGAGAVLISCIKYYVIGGLYKDSKTSACACVCVESLEVLLIILEQHTEVRHSHT